MNTAIELHIFEGVAFDRSLSRLGHGKGYYDQFLSSYVSSGRPKPLLGPSRSRMTELSKLMHILAVALALREQVLDAGQVPMGEYDWKMDMIVTPDEIISLQGDS
jgi:5-formyltetrahydrofolate cyclo-ligase